MGLFRRVGSFASRIWDTIKSVTEPIRAAFDVARQLDVEVEPAIITQEYRKVIRLEGIAEQIASLSGDDYIPPSLFQEAMIPWKRPYAYEVTFAGQNLRTGKFTRESRMITVSRQMTVDEIMQQAEEWFAEGGEYPQIRVTHMSVTGAEYRAGEQYRLW